MFPWQADLVLLLLQLLLSADEAGMACGILPYRSALLAPHLHAGYEMVVLESMALP